MKARTKAPHLCYLCFSILFWGGSRWDGRFPGAEHGTAAWSIPSAAGSHQAPRPVPQFPQFNHFSWPIPLREASDRQRGASGTVPPPGLCPQGHLELVLWFFGGHLELCRPVTAARLWCASVQEERDRRRPRARVSSAHPRPRVIPRGVPVPTGSDADPGGRVPTPSPFALGIWGLKRGQGGGAATRRAEVTMASPGRRQEIHARLPPLPRYCCVQKEPGGCR